MTRSTRVIPVTALILALILTLAGCGTKPVSDGSGTPPPDTKAGILDNLTDQQLISRYIEGLDIALGGDELLFSDASTIPSETLYMFFVLETDLDKLYSPDTWLNKSDNKYHIPLDAVTTTIDKYFSGAKFDPTKVSTYVAATREFVTPVFSGFGGGRFIKLRNKEALSADTIRLTADFYDGEAFKNVVYTKIYTIQITTNGYKYLSIIKP